MRISVELVLSLLAQGEAVEAILADYPGLEPDDIRACIAYAHAVLLTQPFGQPSTGAPVDQKPEKDTA
jgi:uncharacterized protein (DUF433 family)